MKVLLVSTSAAAAVVVAVVIVLTVLLTVPQRTLTSIPNGQIKTNSVALNHMATFTANGNTINVNVRGAQESFIITSLVPFVHIQADGNVIVGEDSDGKLYWKRILRDTRVGQEYRYEFIIDNTWSDNWFNLPVLTRPLYRDLTVRGATGWSVSHKGHYSNQFTKTNGKTGQFTFSCFSVFVLYPTEIRLYDTFVAGFVSIPVPESNIPKISTSGSTIMLTTPVKVYTMFVDYNTIIFHGLKNTWKEHPITLEEGAGYSVETGSIFQTGQHIQIHRLMVLKGWNGSSQQGTYEKHINEDRWEFVPSNTN